MFSIKDLPNKLTIARIATIPAILLLYPFEVEQLRIICALLFLAAAVTDYLDGYVARKYNLTTELGKLLDPIADKMLIGAGLILIAAFGHAPIFLCGLLLCRDIGISGLRLIAREKKIIINVNQFGKYKTFAQLVAIFCLLMKDGWIGLPFRPVGIISLWLAIGFSLYSGYLYFRSYFEQVSQIPNQDTPPV